MNKIFTSYYAMARYFPNDYRLVSISADGGRIARFGGEVYKKLAPKQEFWKVWHDNKGKIDELENNKYYIENYYNQVLRDLNPQEIIGELGDSIVLLCYERAADFCHRHIVAEWLRFNDIEVKEINFKGGTFNEPETPKYIAEILKEVISKSN